MDTVDGHCGGPAHAPGIASTARPVFLVDVYRHLVRRRLAEKREFLVDEYAIQTCLFRVVGSERIANLVSAIHPHSAFLTIGDVLTVP